MKLFYFLLSLSISFSAMAAECFVISGVEKDRSHSLKDRTLFQNESSKIAGKNCTVVKSWKELNEKITAKKLQKGSDILIVQGAHGVNFFDDNKGQTAKFLCDAEEPTAEEVLGHLKKLSGDYRVGATIHSCYSGEIMKQKLLQDETSDENLDKLCLYTSSSTGRITYGQDQDILAQLKSARPGQTLENLFLKVRSGMISSAAWSEIGLPDYFAKETVEQGYKTLQALDKITRGEYSCESNLGAANAALCAAPGITDGIFEDLMTFQNPVIGNSVKDEVITNFKHRINLATDKLKKTPSSKISLAERDCYKFLLETYQSNYGESLENLESWDYIVANTPLFKEMPQISSCLTYSKLLPADQTKSLEEIIQNNFFNGAKLYQESVDKLQRRYSKRAMDDSFDIKDFARAASGEKAVCNPNDKQQIIQSMFGQSFFYDEMADGIQPDEMIYGKNVSTQLALKSFQNASLSYKNQNKKDQLRSKACKDFKL